MGDVRVMGPQAKSPTMAVVEYKGPCGVKRPASVVHLWKDRVMDVVLWLTSPDLDKAIASPLDKTVDLKGRMCEFWPKFVVVKPGTKISITNTDQETEWYVIEEGNKKTQVKQGPNETPVALNVKNEMIHIFSAFHPWMEAWIKPVKNLVATASTEWDGRFYFRNIPGGTYTLHAWNLTLGETEQELTISGDEKFKTKVIYENPADHSPIPTISPTMLEELLGIDKEKHKNPFK